MMMNYMGENQNVTQTWTAVEATKCAILKCLKFLLVTPANVYKGMNKMRKVQIV